MQFKKTKIITVAGTRPEFIKLSETIKLLDDEELRNNFTQILNPYGDGHSSAKILRTIQSHL